MPVRRRSFWVNFEVTHHCNYQNVSSCLKQPNLTIHYWRSSNTVLSCPESRMTQSGSRGGQCGGKTAAFSSRTQAPHRSMGGRNTASPSKSRPPPLVHVSHGHTLALLGSFKKCRCPDQLNQNLGSQDWALCFLNDVHM